MTMYNPCKGMAISRTRKVISSSSSCKKIFFFLTFVAILMVVFISLSMDNKHGTNLDLREGGHGISWISNLQALYKTKKDTKSQFPLAKVGNNGNSNIRDTLFDKKTDFVFSEGPEVPQRRDTEIQSETYDNKTSRQTTPGKLIGSNKGKIVQNDKRLLQRLPNCLIIGFAKCGTFALKTFLALHPNIVAPKKEISFFTFNYDKGKDWYRKQMPLSSESQITIEKTPTYIVDLQALYRIRQFNATIKLIIIVRDPVIRLQSSYAHAKSKKQPNSFQSFEKWIKARSIVNTSGNYAEHIAHVYRLFPSNQVLVLNEEQLEDEPINVMKKVETFLGLPKAFTDDLLVYNADKGFYCFNQSNSSYLKIVEGFKVNKTTGCFNGSKGRQHPDISPQLLTKLMSKLQPLNEKLFSLLGKKFNWTTTVTTL